MVRKAQSIYHLDLCRGSVLFPVLCCHLAINLSQPLSWPRLRNRQPEPLPELLFKAGALLHARLTVNLSGAQITLLLCHLSGLSESLDTRSARLVAMTVSCGLTFATVWLTLCLELPSMLLLVPKLMRTHLPPPHPPGYHFPTAATTLTSPCPDELYELLQFS